MFFISQSGKEFWACVISGFRREVDKNCALLGYYAASCGNFLLTFRDNILFLCSSLLISFPLQFFPVLYSTIVFLCLPALNAVFLPRSSAGLGLLPLSYCSLGFIYLLNVYCTFFPFLPPALLLCLATARVRISSLTERLSSRPIHCLLQSPCLPTTWFNHTGWHHATENLPSSPLCPV